MDPKLQEILKLSYSFSEIERDIYYPDRERPENDAEHALQLALISWYIIESDSVTLDISKIFKLCIAHDLVEIYAGDVPLWGNSGHDKKDSRELEALEILKKKYGRTQDVPSVILEYKERKTKEAKFVYAIDKLLPLLNQINTNGRVWKVHNVSIERALCVLNKHKKVSGYLEKYFDESIIFLKNNEKKYFNT